MACEGNFLKKDLKSYSSLQDSELLKSTSTVWWLHYFLSFLIFFNQPDVFLICFFLLQFLNTTFCFQFQNESLACTALLAWVWHTVTLGSMYWHQFFSFSKDTETSIEDLPLALLKDLFRSKTRKVLLLFLFF